MHGMPAAGVATPRERLCLINTDNVPGNGALLKSHLVRIAVERGATDFEAFLDTQASFHDTMVCVCLCSVYATV